MEITFGDDDADEQNEYEHIYERGENGTPQTIITSRSQHPSIEDAADMFEVPVDELSWIMTREKEQDRGADPASVPCSVCGDSVWTTHQKAAEIRYSSISTTCGSCVENRDGV